MKRMTPDAVESDQVDQKKKKKKNAKYMPFIVGGLFLFLVFVIFYWRNTSEKQAIEVITDNRNNIHEAAAAVDDAEAQRAFYWENLNREKQSLIEQLNANYEEAKKNKELFLQINQETDDESIEASFLLKDDKDNQRVKVVEHNKKLLDQKNRLLERLRQIQEAQAH